MPAPGIGHVYFLRDVGRGIKIGFAVNIEKRLTVLQAGNPSPLVLIGMMPGSLLLEGFIHRHFVDCRITGEWFSDTEEMRARIAALLDHGPESIGYSPPVKTKPRHEPKPDPEFDAIIAQARSLGERMKLLTGESAIHDFFNPQRN